MSAPAPHLLQLPKKKKRNKKKVQFQIRTRKEKKRRKKQSTTSSRSKTPGGSAFVTIVRGRPHSRHLAGPKITTRDCHVMQMIHLNHKIKKLRHEKSNFKNWEIGNPGGGGRTDKRPKFGSVGLKNSSCTTSRRTLTSTCVCFCVFVSSVCVTYLTPSLAATRFHCDRCDKPLSLLTALAKASQFFSKEQAQSRIK